jgi:A/G-specific adenine glycosylase
MGQAKQKLTPTRRRSFSARLLPWFQKNQRALPWRRDTHNPYRIWIAEILLQQTQVATVIPYYRRFLARFPSIRKLAVADLDQVFMVWAGAGYYARARNLHRAAQAIMLRFGGKIPSTVEELRTLPGIGRYTAGAIASIAFGRDASVLDGNVVRVLCRCFNIADDPSKSNTKETLWRLTEELLPHGQAGDFNQALMELGATVCTLHNPACNICPLRRSCVARRLGLQTALPFKRKHKPLPHHQIAIGVVWKRDKILIARRPLEKLLGGLWEFPGGHQEKRESLEECVTREVREELGITISVGEEFAVVQHAYSHLTITLHAFECRWVRGRPRAIGCSAFKWVSLPELSQFAFPTANQKIIAQLSDLHGAI